MNHEPTPYYSHGGIAVYLGNCTEIMPKMAAESFDFCLTDAPYLVNYTGRWDGARKAIVGDDDAAWLYPAFSEIYRLLKPDTFCLSFYGWPHSELFVSAWKAIGFRLVSHVIFVKNVWGLGKMTRGQHETSFLLAKGTPQRFGKPISDVIEWTREQHAIHPNQKPVAALYPVLSTYAPENALVLDPFMGSGSTLRAAKDMGMCGVGIEIEEKYCAGAVRRLAQEVLF
jgi:site-specific DNA-methyltransferase (adenine-specific)